MDNIQNVHVIRTEIEQIIEASYNAIMFDPLDSYTAMNYHSMLSSAIGQLKNKKIIKAFSVDVQITPGKPDKLEGWVSYTPINIVNEIVMNFKIGLQDDTDMDTNTHYHKFDHAMQGI